MDDSDGRSGGDGGGTAPAAGSDGGRRLSVPRSEDELPRLIAHRGFGEDNPENTLSAFRRAARHADAVEMDVRQCGSGELVVIHDASLDRVTDTTGEVGETPLSALREVDVLGTGEGVPTLEAALAAVPPEVAVNVELKEPVVERALPVLDVDNEVMVSSFEADVLARVRELGGPPTARTAVPGNAGDALREAIELGCSAVHPERTAVFFDPNYVDRAHGAGLAVNVWTVRGREDAARLAARGVDGITAESADVLGD